MRAPAGNEPDQTVALQDAERFPDGRAADLEPFGDLVLADFLIGAETILGNFGLDVMDDLIDQRFLRMDGF